MRTNFFLLCLLTLSLVGCKQLNIKSSSVNKTKDESQNNAQVKINKLELWRSQSFNMLNIPLSEIENVFINSGDVDHKFASAIKEYKNIKGWENPIQQFRENYKSGGVSSSNAAFAVDPNFSEKAKGYGGDAVSQYNLGGLLLQSNHNGLAISWYERAAAQGNKYAQNILGKIYQEGVRVNQNLPYAINLYQKSSEQGFHEAQYNLANLYEKGLGVERDYLKSLSLYRAAASKSNIEARKAIARLFKKNLVSLNEATSVDKDYITLYSDNEKFVEGGYDEEKYQSELAKRIEDKAIEAKKNRDLNERETAAEFKKRTANKYDVEKSQCEGLGFKPNTERFARCVLELSK